MNDSRCVSTSTTTRRPRSRPRSPRPSSRATRDMFGNASSVHHFGQQAKAALDDARSAVAALIDARPVGDRLHERRHRSRTTSPSAARPRRSSRPAAGTSSPARSSTKRCSTRCKALARRGWRTTLLPVDHSGHRLARSAARGASPTTRRSSRSCTRTTRSARFSRSRSSRRSRTSAAR